MYSIVLDTNVVISALSSRRGASFAILRQIGEAWVALISIPVILEYEAVGKREAERVGLPASAVDAIVRTFCFVGRETDVYFLLRPFLPTRPRRRIPPRTGSSRPCGRHRHAQRTALCRFGVVWHTGDDTSRVFEDNRGIRRSEERRVGKEC